MPTLRQTVFMLFVQVLQQHSLHIGFVHAAAGLGVEKPLRRSGKRGVMGVVEGEDTEVHDAGGDVAENLLQGFG